ncbi:metalloprotease [Halomicroarcula sp. GCM10025817]|uniref:metalloprotease n=1 Tax=Haloarcula TaxID=2237 RepID=UPI0023E84946|nr:metalloprotease [Halomicroarcula sp. SYNS111]
MNITFSDEELKDLLVAWAALGVAFTLFLERDIRMALLGQIGGLTVSGVVSTLVVSLLTVGVGFLLHELAHKVVAVRFGQLAAFKADYRMLGFAIVGGLAGFLFAAPGAVVHRGRITEREGGLIALAGPVTNLGLALLFIVSVLATQLAGLRGFLLDLTRMGVQINLLLAGFNMIPFGPLDGRKVWSWSKAAFVGTVLAVVLFGVAGFAVL